MLPEHIDYLKKYLADRANTVSVKIQNVLRQKGSLTTAEIAMNLKLTTKQVGDCIISRKLEEKGILKKTGTKHCSINKKNSVAWNIGTTECERKDVA